MNKNQLHVKIIILFLMLAVNQKLLAQKTDSLKSMRYIQNNVIKLGIDLNLGGAITYLAELNKENMINNWDWGRQVQLSFYSGPNPFTPNGKQPSKDWRFLGWNPIQSGDYSGKRSKVLAYTNNGKEMYVKCIPMQWPLDNEPGECTFEVWIKLQGNAVKVRSRINNKRANTTQYEARGQELPAIYTNAPYYKLMSYRGDKPFSNDTVSYINNHNYPAAKSISWAYWQATENWAANVNDDGYGLGIWNPVVQKYGGGFYGDDTYKGNSKTVATGYISPTSTEILDHNIQYTYNYVLIVGSLNQIRNYVYKAAPHNSFPAYNFSNNRQNWIYKNTTDKGWPIRNALAIKLNDSAACISPYTFWKAEDASTLIINAAWKTGVTKAKVYWRLFNTEKFEEANSITFNIIPGGGLHEYKINLKQAAGYIGAMSGIKIDLAAGGGSKEGDEVIIKSIYLRK